MATDLKPRGSRNNNCAYCEDSASTSCATCGEFVCKDCNIDHICREEDKNATKRSPSKA